MSLLCSEEVKEKLVNELLFSGELVANGCLDESDSLEHQLHYLATFAHHNNERVGGHDYTHVEIIPDFAPHSFCFQLWTIPAVPWSANVIRKDSYAASIYPELVGYTKMFFGGLIFHGAHDNGGDGSMSTLSVCLTPVNGWSVHT